MKYQQPFIDEKIETAIFVFFQQLRVTFCGVDDKIPSWPNVNEIEKLKDNMMNVIKPQVYLRQGIEEKVDIDVQIPYDNHQWYGSQLVIKKVI